MLELYNFSQSTCSLKVRICLEEKGLEWVDRRLVSKNHDHLSDWYLKLNPNGVVPTLLDDGRPVFESSVIIQYLDQVHPETPLVPDDPYAQAQMRSWLAFVDAVTTPAIRYPSFQFGGLRQKFQAMSDEEFEEKTARRPLKGAFYRKMDKNAGFSDADMAEAFNDVRKTGARMQRMLDESAGPWLMGEQYTLADIAVAPLLDRIEDLGLEHLWEESSPGVAGWLRRIQARPAYRKAFDHGSRLSDLYPELGLGRGSHAAASGRTATASTG
jgi:glutathione S-transferase